MSATPMLAIIVPLEGAARVVSSNVANDGDVLRLASWIARGGNDRADVILDCLLALRGLDRDDADHHN